MAAIQILIAIWYFDRLNGNQIFVSVLLFMSGIIGFLVGTQSKFLIKLKERLQIIAGIIVVVLLVKLIFVG